MAARQAVCYFCSKPDDSIQVVCETRCLICSRCQLSPVLRKLFLDSLDPTTSPFHQTDDTTPFMTVTSPGITRSSPGTLTAAVMNLSGSCPICCMSLSLGMLRLIQGYKDILRHQSEEESSGKSPSSFELEEISPLIPHFLRRFKTTYEPVNEKPRGGNTVEVVPVAPYDPSDPFAGILTIAATPNTPNTTTAGLGTLTAPANTNKSTPSRKPADFQNDPNAVSKMSSQGMMEFLIDCYCAQWINVCRNGNDSMLTVMMRTATKKKFSQKTNDYKIKSIIDYLISPGGTETAEMILFGYLIGLKPKPSTKISAAWSHIATTLIMTITFDRMQGPQHQAIVQKVNSSYTAAPVVINATEIKHRMLKNLEQTLGAQFTRPCSVKKAVKVVKSLITNQHPYFVMASMTSQCIEYQCRLPWNEETMSKLYTIWLFVLWFEGNIPSKGFEGGNTTNNISGSTKKNNSRRNSEAFMTVDSSSTSQPPSRAMNRRGSSSGNLNGNSLNFGENGKVFASRMDMLQGLDPIIERIWRSNAHPYLKFHHNASFANMSQTQLQYQQQQAYDYIMQLDTIVSAGDTQEFYYLNISDDVFQQIAESYTLSIHELAILVVRCWEVEYAQVKQALNRAMLTSQRRPAIVGSYDITKATMTAKEKLAITRLLHFYREDESATNSSQHANTSSTLPSIYHKYPGLHQYRGIDWDEVEHKCHSNFYPFHVPHTLLTKSMCELNVLAEQVTSLLISQQVKDIEDDLAVKARLAREEEENKLPDIVEFYEDPAHDGRMVLPMDTVELDDMDEDFEEAKEHFIEHMLEAEKELQEAKMHPEASIQHRKAMFKKLKSHSISGSQFDDEKAVELEDKQYETMFHGGHSRLPLVDERPVHALPDLLPRGSQHQQYDEMKESITSGGLQRASLSPVRPISGAHKRPLTKSLPDLHGMIQQLPGSEIPNMDKEPMERLGHILHYPKQQVTMVELIDNNTLALNQARLLPNSSRPTSALKRPKELLPEEKLSHPSGVRLHALEKTVATFPTAEDYALTNNKRPSSKHQVRIETTITDPINGNSKIFVDNERHRIEKKDPINPEDAYKKSIDDYKKSKIQESRSRILQRTTSTMNPALDNMQQDWRASTGSHAAEHPESYLSNVAEEDEFPTQSLSAADILGQFSRPNTSADKGHSSQKRHRIVPYLNVAKFVNDDGDLVMDMSNNLIAESSIQYLTMREGKANLRALQQVVKLFFKEWQVEYMKILDLSGNPGLQSTAARLISQAINVTCNVVHFNFNQAGIGDAGLKMLLNGIIQGKGARHVLRLDLQENQITMASDAMSLLSSFKKLKALDLSKNFFTLDTGAQMRYLEMGLSGCKSLEMISVAFNKIQDNGFRGVCNIIEKYALPVKLLDAAGCFITNKSSDVLKNVLLHVARQPSNTNNDGDATLQALHQKLSPTNPRDRNPTELNVLFKLEKIFLHRNIFSHAVWDELLCDYQMGTLCKLLVNEPHTGIEIFPCYNLRDFGILAPSINPAII